MENTAAGGPPAMAALLLNRVEEVSGILAGLGIGDRDSVFRKDCMDLVRRISLLTHFLEEMKANKAESGRLDASASPVDWCSHLLEAIVDAKSLLLVAATFVSTKDSDGPAKKIALQFQTVTLKLGNALASIPYDQFNISEEVMEQVALVRSQLQRASERYKLDSRMTPALAEATDKEIDLAKKGNRLTRSVLIDKRRNVRHDALEKPDAVSGSDESDSQSADQVTSESNEVDGSKKNNLAKKNMEDLKKPDAPIIPDDFLCPISLELMRDPVIAATGQTYERSYMQRWIDSGNATCPKTQQKLEHFTLTPNYVLRSLITQWCASHNVEQPTGSVNGKIRKKDGSFRDVSGDIAAIQSLARKLSSSCREECKAAISIIRSLSKGSTDNRILIADAGAIPVLVNLLTSEDVSIQENAITAILNLSIYENNKGLIMLAGAIPSIVQILRAGSITAKENAAATLFSLSRCDENKIIIGSSGAISALIELLRNGSPSGKKDAAKALFNLCVYQGNRGRAVRAGIMRPLFKMIYPEGNPLAYEALTILSVLVSHYDAKVIIVNQIPFFVDLLSVSDPRYQEHAAAILLSVCKREPLNLDLLSRLDADIPLKDIAKSGNERAKRKATALLEHLERPTSLLERILSIDEPN